MAKAPKPAERLPMPSGGGSSIRDPKTGELSPNPERMPEPAPASEQET